MTDDAAKPRAGLTRRGLIGAGAAGGIALAAGGGFALGRAEASGDPTGEVVAFHGEHQAGITTPAQDRLHFASFDLTTDSVADLRTLLKEWTAASARMTKGEPAGTENGDPYLPPDDTGEAVGLGPADLTITIGFGPSLFDGRFGLASQRPDRLRPIPRLPADELDPKISDGDVCVQACANDPQVAFHAVRNLAKIAQGVAVMRWCQLGFGRTSRTGASQETPRNLMGFKDGTNNILNDDGGALEQFVWVGDEGPEWMRGGSYLVSRRIRMLIEPWDRTFLQEQEQTFGRMKESGAPIGGSEEKDEVDLGAIGPDGNPLIPADAHIRLASPELNGGERILRRGYSFTDGFDVTRGQLDAGLFFICFQRDPHKQFVRIQEKLGADDRLNEYILHTGSALFAVPGGVSEGGYVGQGLV
ncbi:MAG: deferrochelatase/peroxidase EfeB [Solirubrobacterales bacterium]|nr:deferrochelatase/peroxidase EfeB [Solirubrobacterales bacterium]